MTPPRRGRFIVFEGGEGAGKSTQAALLAERMDAEGLGRPLATREPGGTQAAEQIRALMLADMGWTAEAEALLINAARAQHVADRILPALAEGRHVVCDRFVHSTLAYQGLAEGLDLGALHMLHAFSANLWPDLVVWLDGEPREAMERAARRVAGETRFERRDLAWHQRLRDAFATLAGTDPRVVRVPGDGPPEAVARTVWAAVAPLFSPVPAARG